jgi:hypothetical protein
MLIYQGLFRDIPKIFFAHGISSNDLIQEEYNQQLEGLRSELEAAPESLHGPGFAKNEQFEKQHLLII